MGVFDSGPFDSDSALDFVDEFLDVESPVRSIRIALAQLEEDGYHEVDAVYHAWAACELVAIAASGGEGYDADDVQYEAAARLRPNKKLIEQCLKTLPHILDENSELSDLVGADQRAGFEANLKQTRARLEHGLTLDKFPRLKVPKIKAMQAYAVPAGGKWFVALYDYSILYVLDTTYDQPPQSVEQIHMDGVGVLFNCRYLGSVDDFSALGRLRPSKELTDANVFVTIIRHGGLAGSDGGGFDTNYWLNRGQKFTQQNYDDVREYPYCPEILPERFTEVIEGYATTGTLRFPPVPTPAELRDEFLERCRDQWVPYLEGDGGGPFSFPYLYRMNISYYVLPWIKLHLRSDWTNGGMALPDDLLHYLLAGIVGASVGAYPEKEVPESLVPILVPLREHIGHSEISAAIHVLACLLDEASVIPYVLHDDPPRRQAFLNEAKALRDALAAIALKTRGTLE